MKSKHVIAHLSDTLTMSVYCCYFYTISVALWIKSINGMSMFNKHSYFMDNSDPDIGTVDNIVSKGYLANENDLPKTSVVKNTDNELTYLLSKLSDDELIKLLNKPPKKYEYDLNDIAKLAIDSKFDRDNKLKLDFDESSRLREEYNEYENQNNLHKHRFQTVSDKSKPAIAVFRLENKELDPYGIKSDGDANYKAIQKLSKLLYSRPVDSDDKNEEDEKKEMLFDALVSQLKTLCCKKSKTEAIWNKYRPINEFLPIYSPASEIMAHEHIFLIINDEIKTNGSNDLISVDPESLETNSSVLILGPITTPLTERQLNTVMSRITNELSKPEYVPLLQQLSEGTLIGSNVKLMKSLITGPDTRRYIKPHRCNHQSRLSKIYGGPKWLLCTGYLNLNAVSLYD